MRPNPQSLAIALLAATTLGLGFQLYRTRQQLTDARSAPALDIRRTEIHAATAPAPADIPAPPPPAAAQAPLATDSISASSEGQSTGGARSARFAAQMAELMKDPDFAAAWKLDQEARLDQRYGELFKQLNLQPEKLATFKSLLAERENASREVWASAAAQGFNPRENREQLRQLEADLRAEVDANIESAFGPAVTSALEAYNAAAPQRATVNDLNQKLAYSGQPLNDTQARMLTTLLAQTGQQSGRSMIITDATIARAQGVLMPGQIESLKKLQTEQRARQLIAEKTRLAREQAQAAPAPGGN
jgi:hypothetical protein